MQHFPDHSAALCAANGLSRRVHGVQVLLQRSGAFQQRHAPRIRAAACFGAAHSYRGCCAGGCPELSELRSWRVRRLGIAVGLPARVVSCYGFGLPMHARLLRLFLTGLSRACEAHACTLLLHHTESRCYNKQNDTATAHCFWAFAASCSVPTTCSNAGRPSCNNVCAPTTYITRLDRLRMHARELQGAHALILLQH